MNPQVLDTKALLCGWDISREQNTNGPLLVLARDQWEIRVAFTGQIPAAAMISKPGRAEHVDLNLRSITGWVRGSRHHMALFAIGDRVSVGDRPGTVTDILTDSGGTTGLPCKIRLVVAYDDGGHGQPYTTHAQPLEEAA